MSSFHSSFRSLLLASVTGSLLLLAGEEARSQSAPTPPNPVSPITGAGPSWTTGWSNAWKSKQDLLAKEIIYANARYGVVGDGILNSTGTDMLSGTDNTVALNAAINACAAVGGRLQLPPGIIWIKGSGTYGNITTQLKNCMVVAAGGLGPTLGDTGSYGTMIVLTNTSVKPFNIGNSWSWSDTVFYHPRQPVTAASVVAYPPIFSPTTETTSTYGWYLDHVDIVNAYDGVVAAGGSFQITNSYIYTLRDAIRVASIGDSFKLNNLHFTPGPWFTLTNFASVAAIGTATNTNTIIHAQAGGNNAINVDVFAVSAFAWRYGLKVDNGVTVGLSNFEWYFDGVGTVLDTSSGGVFAGTSQTPMRGSAGCSHVDPPLYLTPGNKPCFNLGTNSSLYLDGWIGSSTGSFIVAGDANIVLNGVHVTSIGTVVDGNEYYGIHGTANSGGVNIKVRNSSIAGIPASTKVHGIKTDVAINTLVVQNSSFIYLNEVLDVQSAGVATLISGNDSQTTQGTASIKASTMLTGATGVIHQNNHWDKPPASTITTVGDCGGSGEAVFGAFSGYIQVGATNPTTSCKFRLPWVPYGSGGGACQATVNGTTAISVSAGVSGRDWTISSGAVDMHGVQLFFNCPGQN